MRMTQLRSAAYMAGVIAKGERVSADVTCSPPVGRDKFWGRQRRGCRSSRCTALAPSIVVVVVVLHGVCISLTTKLAAWSEKRL